MPDQLENPFLAGFRRRKIPAIFFLLPFFFLILIGLAWYEVSARVEREYQIEVEAIYRESDNMIRSFEDHARRNLQNVDDSLLFIKMQYEAKGGLTPELSAFMQNRRSRLIEEIYLFDSFGKSIGGAPIRRI